MTPHTAGEPEGLFYHQKRFRFFAENVQRVLDGLVPEHALNEIPVLKTEPEYGGVPGATDGTFLRALKGIPIVTMGAGDREVPHQVDEWVDLNQLVDTAKIYALAGLHYLKGEDR